jgi:hypothetical protein
VLHSFVALPTYIRQGCKSLQGKALQLIRYEKGQEPILELNIRKMLYLDRLGPCSQIID